MITGNYRVESGHREILYSVKGKIFYRKSDLFNGYRESLCYAHAGYREERESLFYEPASYRVKSGQGNPLLSKGKKLAV